MGKIAFFCILAWGHTNPTLEVVRILTERGNEVWYYSYDMFREKISAAGARFISCDSYDIQTRLSREDAERIVRDIAFSTEILVNTTLALDDAIIDEMKQWKPDCIVADSMAIWGKLIAAKLGIPFVSSTTTFAFNRYSAGIMKQGLGELLGMLRSASKAGKHLKRLRLKGYSVKNVLSLIQNDNDTNTIVYTSPEFQPCSGTFSDKYTFVGPSIRKSEYNAKVSDRRCIYISLGTVLTQNVPFFRNCIAALRDSADPVIMSVGDLIDVGDLGDIPENFQVERSVDQIAVLQNASVFLTHCGMNSVNEALYYEVPLILYPQTKEQQGVAYRVREMGAGIDLKENSPFAVREAVREAGRNPVYKENARKIAESFRNCGGPGLAADMIMQAAKKRIEM